MRCKLVVLYMIYVLSATAENGIEQFLRTCSNSAYFDFERTRFNPPLPQLHLTNDSFHFTIKELPRNVTAVNWWTLVNVTNDVHDTHHGHFVKLSDNTWVAKPDRVTWKPKQRLHAWFSYYVNTTFGFPFEVDDVIIYDRKRKRVHEYVKTRGALTNQCLPIEHILLSRKLSGSVKSRKVLIKNTSASRRTTRRKVSVLNCAN